MVATSTCLVALACPSFAADWSADTSLSQSVEASDNRQLATSPLGGTITSLSTLSLNVTARTPTSRFDFNGDVNYTAYAGPGAANINNALGNNLSLRYEEKRKLFDYYIVGAWNRSDASTVQLQQFGFSTLSGEVNTYSLTGGSRFDLTARDTLIFSASGAYSQFAADSSTTTSNQTSATWSHQLSPRTDWNTSVRFNWTSREGGSISETMLWTAMTGLRTDLTPRLSFIGNAGAGVATGSGGSAAPIFGSALDAAGGAASDWLADARLVYSMKNTQFSIFASKSVSPTTFGEFTSSYIGGFGVRHDINWYSNLDFSGSFSRISAASTGTYDLYSASVAYSYQLARDWNAQLSYRYAQRLSATQGMAQSNTVLGRITYNYTLLP
jgi:hypothetical protein